MLLIKWDHGKKQNIKVNKKWLIQQLHTKIQSIDWDAAKQDVSRFLRAHEQATLKLWSDDFFLSRLEKLSNYL